MTSDQIKTIDWLRAQGCGYRRIAERTGISMNTVKSYCRRVPVPLDAAMDACPIPEASIVIPMDEPAGPEKPIDAPPVAREAKPAPSPSVLATLLPCRMCGAPVEQTPGRKEKKFCSKACSVQWWNRNRYSLNRKACQQVMCPTCGKEFIAYGSAGRKYCSHDCYLVGRFHKELIRA